MERSSAGATKWSHQWGRHSHLPRCARFRPKAFSLPQMLELLAMQSSLLFKPSQQCGVTCLSITESTLPKQIIFESGLQASLLPNCRRQWIGRQTEGGHLMALSKRQRVQKVCKRCLQNANHCLAAPRKKRKPYKPCKPRIRTKSPR